jgi:hypothetical protein
MIYSNIISSFRVDSVEIESDSALSQLWWGPHCVDSVEGDWDSTSTESPWNDQNFEYLRD